MIGLIIKIMVLSLSLFWVYSKLIYSANGSWGWGIVMIFVTAINRFNYFQKRVDYCLHLTKCDYKITEKAAKYL